MLTAQPVPPGSPITVSLLYACSSLTAASCTDVRIDIPRPTGQPGNIAVTMAGPVAAGTTIDVQVSGQGGIPASGASAVILNATVTQPAALGWLTMFPTGASRPRGI